MSQPEKSIPIKALFFKAALAPSVPEIVFGGDGGIVNNRIIARETPRGSITISYTPERRHHRVTVTMKNESKSYFFPESWCAWEPLVTA